jgi:transcriptional regulator GlxA family with amidase domain
MRIEVLIFDGFDELDAIAPYEVFRHASRLEPIDLALVTYTGANEILGGNGIRFTGLSRWSPEHADVLVVPGGGARRSGPGVRHELEDGGLPQALAAMRSGVLASVCSGSLLLGGAGVLNGRHATTHHSVWDQLEGFGAIPTKARVVDEGDIVTAGGVTSGLDLGLHLLDRLVGPELALAVETELEYERRGVVWRSPSAA